MTIKADDAARYLKQYVESYRREYQRFTASPPKGGGYPALRISPYLYSTELTCHLADDGVAVADFSWQPPYQWEIVGGPTLLVDFPETRTPSEIVDLLKREGIWGKDIGIYRIVSEDGFPDEVWCGRLPKPKDAAKEAVESKTLIRVFRYDIDWNTLIQRLTFGAFCKILDLKLPNQGSNFWNPRIIRNLGFATADRQHKRFYHYLELLPHVEKAAWDTRSIWTRVHVDIRRDFAHAIGAGGRQGGIVAFDKPEAQIGLFYDRLSALKEAIDKFEVLLENYGGKDESVFHEFLKENSVLLDVYGEPISKPRFYYPEGESPLGKEYVEPDFIIRYPGNVYKLVELEKPGKAVATKKGYPRAEVSQAAFQIAEWKTYILNHYEVIKQKFPGIVVNHSSMIVIGRASEENLRSKKDVRRYMELVKESFSVDDVFLYNDLLNRARQAYIRLCGMTIERNEPEKWE